MVLFYVSLLWLFNGKSPALSYTIFTSGSILQISASNGTSTKWRFLQVALSDGTELCNITINVIIEKKIDGI